MKKICFIMTDSISFNVLCRDQLEFFTQMEGVDLTLICGGSPHNIEILKKRNVGKVIYFPLIRKPSLFLDLFCLIKLFLFFVFNRFDLVVYSTPKALLLCSIATFFSFQKKRLAIVQGRVYENFYGLKKALFQILDKISFLFSTKVLFVSRSLMNISIFENLVSEKKSFVINEGSFNGVDLDKFIPVNAECKRRLREKWGIKENIFTICTVGRLCKDKGIEELQDIIANFTGKEIYFLIVGSIEDQFSEKILSNILKNSNVKHIDHIDHVEEVFQISDLHLFLSYREGFGNVAIEAASCNVPTFAYDVTGIKDSVNHGVTGLRFEFKDIHSISAEIEKSVKHPLLFKEKFSKSRDWAVKNFEQEKVWENYLNFYKETINNGLNRD